MNQVYMEKRFSVKKLSDKNDRMEMLINKWIDQWRRRRQLQRNWDNFMTWLAPRKNKSKNKAFCDQFYQRGLAQRHFRHVKLYFQVAGNRLYERQTKEKITIEVAAKVEEKKLQFEFLESMIKELEEKLRIELRKKAILKNQCDQAYLRGVSAISGEALKMSYSTLEDYYRGMKMPQYDGNNIYNQMRSLNAETTLTAQIHTEHRAEEEARMASSSVPNSGRKATELQFDEPNREFSAEQSFGR